MKNKFFEIMGAIFIILVLVNIGLIAFNVLSIIKCIAIVVLGVITITMVITKIILEAKPSVTKADESMYPVAIHEAGHAIIEMLSGGEILSVKILKCSQGQTNIHDSDNSKNKEEIIQRIITYYAGIVAENVILGKKYEGSSSDLTTATKLAYKVVISGMNNNIMSTIGDDDFDKMLKEKIFSEVERLCTECYKKAEILVQNNKQVIIEFAKLLMERKELTKNEIIQFRNEYFDSNDEE